ncbi:MAG: hypothetical protein NVS3B10_22160 [Polyangiales bacterium]
MPRFEGSTRIRRRRVEITAFGESAAGISREHSTEAIETDTATRVDNLLAVPSYHYDPVFAGHVRDAFATFRPTVVALELPAGLAPELEWALRCWPTPVCVLGRASFVPLVPGDSVVEAYRLARRDGVPVRLIDLRHDAPIDHPQIRLPGADARSSSTPSPRSSLPPARARSRTSGARRSWPRTSPG